MFGLKITLNKIARVENVPIPFIKGMANDLEGGEIFTKLDFDLSNTQLRLSEDAEVYTSIKYHKSLFRICFALELSELQLVKKKQLLKSYLVVLHSVEITMMICTSQVEMMLNILNIYKKCYQYVKTLG